MPTLRRWSPSASPTGCRTPGSWPSSAPSAGLSGNAGTFSRRLDERSFLITPRGCDRSEVAAEDLVVVRDGQREAGKTPSRAALLHRMLYELHPAVGAVILAQPPNLTAFSISHTRLDTRIMPESFVLLREVRLLPFAMLYRDPAALARSLSPQRPLLLIENEGLLVTGANLLQAFDRLEVAEFTAKSILQARREISDAYIRD